MHFRTLRSPARSLSSRRPAALATVFTVLLTAGSWLSASEAHA